MSEYGEPWSEGLRHESMCQIEMAGDQSILTIKSSVPLNHATFDAYLKRLIACVNACAGISDEQLQAVADGRLSIITARFFDPLADRMAVREDGTLPEKRAVVGKLDDAVSDSMRGDQ